MFVLYNQEKEQTFETFVLNMQWQIDIAKQGIEIYRKYKAEENTMNAGASERRIRNNRIRRQRELRRHIFMGVLAIALVIGLSLVFFSFGTKAQSNDEEILYKYYKSIVVEEGDTLWKYAGLYGEESYYSNRQEYIDEVVNMNALKDETITVGQHIILPYYSTVFNS